MPELNDNQFGYVGGHKPMPNSPALHEVEKAYPDIHEHPEYYTATWARRGSPEHLADQQSLRAINETRGKPDAPVTMFRAVPHGVSEINPGDWVTPSHAYARQHLEGMGSGKVISARTQAKYLRSDGDFHHEYGYWGPSSQKAR